MNKFWMMLVHTYGTKLKTKSFIVTTIILVAAIFLMANINKIISYFDGHEVKHIAVLDESNGVIFAPLKTSLAAVDKDIKLEKSGDDETALKKQVSEGKLDGYLVLSLDERQLPKAVYRSESSDSNTADRLKNALQTVKGQMVAGKLQLTSDKLALLNSPVSFEKVPLDRKAQSKEQQGAASALVYVLLIAIYMSVLMYANMIATEVAVEKSSRVMEILISSVSPIKQMFAKILGVGLLGLTQIIIAIAAGVLALQTNSEVLSFIKHFHISSMAASTIGYAIVFFLLGYFLYATLAALLGSLVSRVEDIQQMVLPMTFLVVIGFMVSMYGMNQPDAAFVTVASYIPFFTPMIMFMRYGLLGIPTWEVLVGIAIMIVSIIILAVMGARIYRGGVLMYGTSSSLKNIKTAFLLTKKEPTSERKKNIPF
ncbi:MULTISPECIES: ABC transporter permease [Bacillus]|jgi:ABC-2 type transport system permease protein|uniref:ABC transporter permease n=1 Tax=Bacillus TaxID=1386 RepID=UPI00065DF1D8|nr:ABC transporter permease [Bacillus smithii]AKP48833.1 ABC transporterpermease protein [Bacillus smithii]MED4884341.1 ABC transporter permease [Bacillus smithii]MED4928603.1 ABC transporter permease [Bacillus smithii]